MNVDLWVHDSLFKTLATLQTVSITEIDHMDQVDIKHGLEWGNNSKQVFLTPVAQCRAEFEPCDERHLAERKSPVLTAQTIQPA